MKKFVFAITFIYLITLTSCASDNATNTKENPPSPLETTMPTASSIPLESVADYYPIKINTHYYYEGRGNEYASYDVQVDYSSENAIQERISNGGTVMARVVKIEDGTVTSVFSQGEVYYRENCLSKTNDKNDVLLMEPLIEGTTWTLNDGRTRTITGINIDVTTPLGNYITLEVTTKGPEDTILDYYAKNIGLVKSIFISGDNEISSSLSKIEENLPLSQVINFYYPSSQEEKLHVVTKNVIFKTNDPTKEIMLASYKELASDLEPAFTTNTKINSLSLNKDAVYIDLNSTFLSEINKDAIYERAVLQCIANTFGEYYSTEKVLLTIESKPYKSDNLTLEKGEFLNVNYDLVQ